MSTDWNVHCRTCNSTLHFDDANHEDELMLELCKHAKAIGGLAGLFRSKGRDGVELRTSYGAIDTEWFRDHADHDLIPISEYGDLLDQCGEYVQCQCGSNRRCTEKLGHDGEHRVEVARR